MAGLKTYYTHQVIYADSGRVIITTPKGWARDHQEAFPKFTFAGDDVPRTSAINKYLDSIGFKTTTSVELIIHYKF